MQRISHVTEVKIKSFVSFSYTSVRSSVSVDNNKTTEIQSKSKSNGFATSKKCPAQKYQRYYAELDTFNKHIAVNDIRILCV